MNGREWWGVEPSLIISWKREVPANTNVPLFFFIPSLYYCVPRERERERVKIIMEKEHHILRFIVFKKASLLAAAAAAETRPSSFFLSLVVVVAVARS